VKKGVEEAMAITADQTPPEERLNESIVRLLGNSLADSGWLGVRLSVENSRS
jgi:hypothetical protein